MPIGNPFVKKSRKLEPSEVRKEEQAFWADMKPWLASAIVVSLGGEGAVKRLTRAEIQTRMDMAYELVNEMRRDKCWSKPRIRDTLPHALRAKVIGIEFDLDALARRGSW